MFNTLINWVNINSHATHLEGIARMRDLLKDSFIELNGQIEEVPLPPYKKISADGTIQEFEAGPCLKITKREKAPFQIFLGGHMDTVFTKTSHFQQARWEGKKRLVGPGVADMKGGLFVMLQALLEFEKHPLAERVGWEVFINTDEEIGSPSSRTYFQKLGTKFQASLLFEPAFPDGAIAGKRKGSLSIYAVAKGKEAHAGRDFEMGKNAIGFICDFASEAKKLTDLKKGLTLNLGYIQGGGSLNVVPDISVLGINARMETTSDLETLQKTLKHLSGEDITLFEHSVRPPKPLNGISQSLFKLFEEVTEEMNDPLILRETGGTCDGNLLQAYGLRCIDALGPIGGQIHTEHEYLEVDSIEKRIERATNLLIALAKGNR